MKEYLTNLKHKPLAVRIRFVGLVTFIWIVFLLLVSSFVGCTIPEEHRTDTVTVTDTTESLPVPNAPVARNSRKAHDAFMKDLRQRTTTINRRLDVLLASYTDGIRSARARADADKIYQVTKTSHSQLQKLHEQLIEVVDELKATKTDPDWGKFYGPVQKRIVEATEKQAGDMVDLLVSYEQTMKKYELLF